MTRLVLSVFDLLRAPLQRLGVDYPAFRLLLQLKLTLDKRRPLAGMHSAAPATNFLRSALIPQLLVGAMIALLPGPAAPLAALVVILSFVMLMLGMTLISDFTNVLHDPADDAVLRPRPVSARTVFAARVAHAASYIALSALCLGAGALLVGAFKRPLLFPPTFLLALALSATLVVAFVYAVYLGAMRVFEPRRFRDIANYLQIGLTVALSISYVAMPRLFDTVGLSDADPASHAWIYFVPPAWTAALPAMALGARGATVVRLAVIGVVAPLAGLALVLGALAPAYRRSLQVQQASRAARAPRRRGADLPAALSRLVFRRPPRRGAFALVWRLTGRDRGMKLRLYPGMAMFVVLMATQILFFKPSGGWSVADLRETHLYVLLLYMAAFVGALPMTEVARSDQHKGAWVYTALPFPRPGDALLGGVAALAVRFGGPFFGMAGGLTLAIWGPRKLPDLVLAMSTALVLFGTLALFVVARLPFSAPVARGGPGLRSVLGVVSVLVVGLVGLAHYFLDRTRFGVLVGALVASTAAALLLRRCGRAGWDAVAPIGS